MFRAKIKSPEPTGWEIQPYMGPGEEEGGENQNSTTKGSQVSNIVDQIRAVVGKRVRDLRAKVQEEENETKAREAAEGENVAPEAEAAVPISFKRPTEEIVHPFEYTQMGDQQRPKKRNKCPIAGRATVSFTLPEDLLEMADNIQLYTSEDLVPPKTHRRYTVRQRTEGWTIERRQRATKRYDSYFIHRESRGLFRSAVEVTDFILYETYPDKPTPKPKKKNAEEGSSSQVPTGEGNTPVRKKVGRPRKNKVDVEQGSTPERRKVGRPNKNKVDVEQGSTPERRKVGRSRKVVEGEKETSSVHVVRKPRKKMEKEKTPSEAKRNAVLHEMYNSNYKPRGLLKRYDQKIKIKEKMRQQSNKGVVINEEDNDRNTDEDEQKQYVGGLLPMKDFQLFFKFKPRTFCEAKNITDTEAKNIIDTEKFIIPEKEKGKQAAMDEEETSKKGINKIENMSVINFNKDELEKMMMTNGDKVIFEDSNMPMTQSNEKVIFTSATEDFESLMNLVDEAVKSTSDVAKPRARC